MSFVKQILKGAAVQLGVQAVVETAWPKVKTITNKFLDKLQEQKAKKDLKEVMDETEKRARHSTPEPIIDAEVVDDEDTDATE